MKTDARVRYTKRVIKERFFECLSEKTLKDITVKEICDRAGINRATFYKHYRDCYDLIEQLENDQLEEFRILLENSNKFSQGLIPGIIGLLDRNRELNDAIVKGDIQDGLRKKMFSVAHEYSIEDWKKLLPKASPQEVELLFTSAATALFYLIMVERKNYDKDTIIDFANRFLDNVTSIYR